eukprot:scaffold99127_cov63-Phaeocystis_antarctica.AAC.2
MMLPLETTCQANGTHGSLCTKGLRPRGSEMCYPGWLPFCPFLASILIRQHPCGLCEEHVVAPRGCGVLRSSQCGGGGVRIDRGHRFDAPVPPEH